jgi:hypothetical protein
MFPRKGHFLALTEYQLLLTGYHFLPSNYYSLSLTGSQLLLRQVRFRVSV